MITYILIYIIISMQTESEIITKQIDKILDNIKAMDSALRNRVEEMDNRLKRLEFIMAKANNPQLLENVKVENKEYVSSMCSAFF